MSILSSNYLAQNIAHLLVTHGNLSISDLAKTTGIPQPTLHHLLAGKTRRPRKNLVKTLANFFSITPEQLLGEHPIPLIIPEKIKEMYKITAVPFITWEVLSNWPNNVEYFNPEREIIVNNLLSKDSFAIIVNSSLIELLRIFSENTVLIFDNRKTLKDKDYAIIFSKKFSKIEFSRIYLEKNFVYAKLDLLDGNEKLIKLDMEVDRVVGILSEARIPY
ncbi:MAG: helix-turn-helix transcriptional regulator [Legionellales bacterium]|nr:helix-turn-helix transcriptional regulator [Legionellales bacterium]